MYTCVVWKENGGLEVGCLIRLYCVGAYPTIICDPDSINI